MAKTKYHVTFFFSQYTFDYISSNIRPSQLESSGHENYGEAKKIKGSIDQLRTWQIFIFCGDFSKNTYSVMNK